MLSRLVLAALFVHSALAKCENSQRTSVKWYFDEAKRMCLAYRIDCIARFKVSSFFFDSEEQCTLSRMSTDGLQIWIFALGTNWKNIRVRCPIDTRMATFQRSNGDQVPFLFSSNLCHSDGFSDLCEKSESCFTIDWIGFCCNDEAFLGDGPNAGMYNVTGIGGPGVHITGAAKSEPVTEAPINCNEDGDRNEVEWYRNPNGLGCVAQRMQCSEPKFGRTVRRDVFPDEQSCMDFWFHITRTFDCGEEGFSAAIDSNGVPLVFEKQLCGAPHDSDFCNRDEVCQSFSGENVSYCCQRSSEGVFKYTQSGQEGVETIQPKDSFDFMLENSGEPS